jgi:hypothetical protein
MRAWDSRSYQAASIAGWKPRGDRTARRPCVTEAAAGGSFEMVVFGLPVDQDILRD